ncbi:unnamed protein product [Wuchereria bancrofti]|uniref:Uncharacterized protein n=1 Tax=Wuchereria bancrofti TaxID=6293 RepID=A0A3P7EUL6_WUCBA|nr:unnamed protein product [Wuchereria bancrofti]
MGQCTCSHFEIWFGKSKIVILHDCRLLGLRLSLFCEDADHWKMWSNVKSAEHAGVRSYELDRHELASSDPDIIEQYRFSAEHNCSDQIITRCHESH